jgi:hypothetical protein
MEIGHGRQRMERECSPTAEGIALGSGAVGVDGCAGRRPVCGPCPLLCSSLSCISLRGASVGCGHVRQGRAGPQGCDGQLQGYGLRRHYATLRHYAALRVPALEMQRADRGFALKNTS